MGRKKGRPSNTPRTKRFRQDQRLQSAKSWLPTYEGKNVFRGYRKRYGVDWPTALRELEMLGVEVTPAYREQVLRTVQEQAEARKRKRLEKAAELDRLSGIEQDEILPTSSSTHLAGLCTASPGRNGRRDGDSEPEDDAASLPTSLLGMCKW